MPYAAPLMDTADILECLDQLGFGALLSPAQMAQPNAEVTTKLFEELVKLLVGVSRCAAARTQSRRAASHPSRRARSEELQQPVFAALPALQQPQLHEESIGMLALARHLYRLMHASGVHDFALKARRCTTARARTPGRLARAASRPATHPMRTARRTCTRRKRAV